MTSLATLTEAVGVHARDEANGATLTDARGGILRYADLWAWSASAAVEMQLAGVKSGSPVGLMMLNSLDTIVVMLAIMRLNAVLVPLQSRLRHRVDRGDTLALLAALQSARACHCVVPHANSSFLSNVRADRGTGTVIVSIEKLLAARHDRFVEYPIDPASPAILQFSSGSTRLPKGIVLSHANVVANTAGIAEASEGTGADHLVTWLPLYHDMGLIGCVATTLWRGATLTLLPPVRFLASPLNWIRTLSTTGATHSAAPQFAYRLATAKANVSSSSIVDCELSSLRYLANGGEPIHPALSHDFEDRFSRYGLRECVLQPVYGLAESTCAVTMRKPGTTVPVRHFLRDSLAAGQVRLSDDQSPASISVVGNGTPIRGTEVTVRGADGVAAPQGELGEIHVAGTSCAQWCVEEHGEWQTMSSDGWIATGDVGTVVDGELYIAGRTKEMFKHAGLAYAPTDIEAMILERIPQLADVCAFGVFDIDFGEERFMIVAETARGRGSDVDELADTVRLVLAQEFRVTPEDVIFVRRGAIPKTTSGKTRRLEARRAYLDGSLSRDEFTGTARSES